MVEGDDRALALVVEVGEQLEFDDGAAPVDLGLSPPDVLRVGFVLRVGQRLFETDDVDRPGGDF